MEHNQLTRPASNGVKYLSIDYGTKRVGLAVSSNDIAFPRGVVPNDADLNSALKQIIEKERIEHILVGDTRSFGGRENPVTKEAEAFIERLKIETNLPVTAISEAGSSIEASRYAPNEEKHDDAAAAFILQRFLDMRVQ